MVSILEPHDVLVSLLIDVACGKRPRPITCHPNAAVIVRECVGRGVTESMKCLFYPERGQYGGRTDIFAITKIPSRL
jgi:hypothetical protein